MGFLRSTLKGVAKMSLEFTKEEVEEELCEKSSGLRHRTLRADADVSAKAARHEVRTIGSEHQHIIGEWKKLHRFVHTTEDSIAMVAPVQVCCRKCSVQGVEKHILGTLAGLTAMGFLGMLWAIRYFGGIPEEQEGDAVSADVSNTALGTNESSDLNASNVTNATNASASAVAPVDVVDPVAAALADQQAKSGANAVWTAMVTAMSTSFVCLILFSIVRPRLPQAYMARQEFWDDKADKETFKQLSKGFFSWLPELMNMREEELVFKVGFDGYIFLRCLFVDSTIFHCSNRAKAFYFTPPAFSNRLPHIAAKFCVCSLIPVGIPLMIISHFANWNSGDPVTLEGLTVGNIPSGDWRLWFFAVAAWYEVLLMLKLLRDEEFVYIRVRHQFLRSPRASDYSVLVLDLPKDYRTNKDLRDLFLHMHPDVHSATVLADCAKLDDLIATASKCSDDLAAMLKKKDRGQTMVGACCKKKRSIATEVEELECSLDKANTAMQNEQQAVKTKLRVTVQAERAAESVERQKSRRIADTRSIDDAAAVAKETAAEAMKLISARKMPEGKACMPCRLLWSITFGALCCSKHIGDTRRHGIVTFDNIRAATVARQVVHDSHVLDFHLTVNEAPDPGDILWRNMGAGNLERQLRSKIGTMLDFWLIAFWSVPVVFITSLVSIEALSKRMPWLKPVIEIEVVKGLLEGTVPALILAALLGLLPELLKKTTTYQGAMTHSEVERSAIGKYFFFLVFNVFLLASLSGSLFDSITVLIDDPTNLPNMLGKTLPAQSNFFIGYILLNGVSGFFVQLLTIGRVVSALLFRSKKTGPELSGGNPFPTDYVRSAAKLLLILVLAISYSVMAPLVLLPALMSFGTIYTVHKYLLIFMWESEFDSGGRMWPVFVTSVLFGLSIAVLTLIGLFGLKEGYSQVLAILPLLVLIYWASGQFLGRFERVARYLPLLECHAAGQDGIQPLAATPEHEARLRGKLSFLNHAYRPESLSVKPFIVTTDIDETTEVPEPEQTKDTEPCKSEDGAKDLTSESANDAEIQPEDLNLEIRIEQSNPSP